MDQFSTNIQTGDKIKKSWWKKAIKFYTGIFLLGVFFVGGMVFGLQYREPQDSQKVIDETSKGLKNIFSNQDNIDTDLFEEVWNVLHNEYLDKANINDQDLFYGAISGMVNALGDPHSIFLDPQLAKEFSQELEGSFSGIGAEIGLRDGYLVVIAALTGTPAEKAGLKSGDRILAVDDKDMAGISSSEAVTHIRGERGTEVTLTILPKNSQTPKQLTIMREKIDIPSVVYKTEDNIAIIEITNFNDDTDERLAKVAQQIINDNPSGVIIDLRNNPGGYLSTAVEIASYWLEPEQVVVREIFSDKRNDQDYKAFKRNSLAHFKTVVLVNEGSASASEILAGALQDYNLAQIVGMTTFGKGSVQQLMNLKDRSSVKLTVAKWLTPNGRTIDGQGIKPDYEIDLSVEDYDNGLDPQLDKAKELILQ